MHDDDAGPNVDVNLCELLNIDVDKIALRIAMGEDPWADQDDEEEKDDPEQEHTPQKKEGLSATNADYGLNKTDNKQSTLSSMSRKSQYRSQSDMKLQESSNITKTDDGLLKVPSDVNQEVSSSPHEETCRFTKS